MSELGTFSSPFGQSVIVGELCRLVVVTADNVMMVKVVKLGDGQVKTSKTQ